MLDEATVLIDGAEDEDKAFLEPSTVQELNEVSTHAYRALKTLRGAIHETAAEIDRIDELRAQKATSEEL